MKIKITNESMKNDFKPGKQASRHEKLWRLKKEGRGVDEEGGGVDEEGGGVDEEG